VCSQDLFERTRLQMADHDEIWLRDDAEPCDRHGADGVTIVAGDTATDAHGLLSAHTRKSPGGASAGAGIEQAFVSREIGRRLGSAMRGEIGGRGARNEPGHANAFRDERTIGKPPSRAVRSPSPAPRPR
jgi:hypothetical protein